MAGHSKWANIQHRKGRQDEKRGKIWTRVIREIMVAARLGGGDLSINPRLRLAVEKAKAANLPVDTVKCNIDKATGNLEGVNYEEIRYEGYGIGGAAIIVDTMTDNQVRTVAEVRHAFSKYGGNMGTAGSVAFQFKHCGQLIFAPGTSEDKVMEVALEAGAEDVITDDDGAIEVLTAAGRFRSREKRAGGRRPDSRSGRSDHAPRKHHRTQRRRCRHECRNCWTFWKTWTTCRTCFTTRTSYDPLPCPVLCPSQPLAEASTRPETLNRGRCHESTGDWRRWPRTRDGLEAGAVAQGSAGVCGAGQRRHGARPEPANIDLTDVQALRDWAHGEQNRADRGRAGSAAGGRCGGRVPRARPAHLRPDQGGRATGKLQGVFQGLHAAPRHSHGRIRNLFRPRGRTRLCGRHGRAHRGQGRRPGGRQGRGGGHDRWPRRTRPSTSCWWTTPWACCTTKVAPAS